MGNFLKRLKQKMLKSYTIDVEIKLNDNPIHHQSITLYAYHKPAATKKAVAMAIDAIEVSAIGCKLAK